MWSVVTKPLGTTTMLSLVKDAKGSSEEASQKMQCTSVKMEATVRWTCT